MANTIGTSTLSETWRVSYASSKLDLSLRTAVVSQKIFIKDNTNSKYVGNPYLSAFTAAVATMAGTYAVSTATTADDTLTVTDQISAGVHDYEFEETQSRVDLWRSYMEDISADVAVKADYFILNKMTDGAGESYSTPTGGFTTPANIPQIIGDLTAKMAGYGDAYKGLFLVIENTDLTGFTQFGMSAGFSFADMTLNNGFAGRVGGVDIYVVRSGVFATATIGTLTATNSGHRLFGVKNIHTFAMPGGIHYDEKKVTLKTGKEFSCWANVGAKVWTQKANLLCDITIT